MTLVKRVLQFGFLFFLSGCASKGSYTHVSYPLVKLDSQEEVSSPLRGLATMQYRVVKVESDKAGRALVENKRSFLIDLFRQSEDPYFGTLRWSEECLKRNQIGELNINGNHVEFQARLSVDGRWNPGECTSKAVEANLLVKYCPAEQLAVTVFLTGQKSMSAKVVCGDPVRIGI